MPTKSGSRLANTNNSENALKRILGQKLKVSLKKTTILKHRDLT